MKPREKVLKAQLHACADDVDALHEYCDLLMNDDRAREARKWVMKALALRPDDARLAVMNATLLFAEDMHDAAIVEFERAERLGADVSKCLTGKGSVFASLGRVEEALPLFQRARDLAPNDVVALQCCADALQQLGRFDEARTFYESVLRIDPTDLDARLGAAGSYFELGRFERARFFYEQVLRDDPEDEVAVSGVAESLFKLERVEDGLRTLEEFTADHPKAITALHTLFCLYDESEHLVDAIEIGRRIVRIEDDENVRLMLASLFLSDGKLDDAAEHARRALALNSSSIHARAVIAKIAIRKGDSEEVERQIAIMVREDPERFEELREVLKDYEAECEGRGS